MNSKPGSRLSTKQGIQEINPSLKQKIEALEGKYNEFISNCSTFLKDETKPKIDAKSQNFSEKLSQKREPHNEYYKEVLKLRRENKVLTKTIDELSSKLSVVEGAQTEVLIHKELEEKFEDKKKMLDRQEQNFLFLQQELEKTKNELGIIKNKYREPESQMGRSATPGLGKNFKNPKIKIPKSKEYLPISRNRSGSPIGRSISPKDRITHNIKKELSSLKQELEKTKEERNLYKSWKDYCSNHPPVSPAIHTIINHYEIEIKKIKTFNTIIQNKAENLAKVVNELLIEIEKKSNTRQEKCENLKAEVRSKIKELKVEDVLEKNNTLKHIKEKKIEVMRASKYEKENKDLEDILRREKTIAEIFSDVVKIKSNEINDYKQSIETMSVSDKYYFNSVPTGKVTESYCENCYSLLSTPYSKNFNFEMSFNSKDKFNQIGNFTEIFETVEKNMSQTMKIIDNAFEQKINLFSQFLEKFDRIRGSFQKKIRSLERKIIDQEFNFEELLKDTEKKYDEKNRDYEKEMRRIENLNKIFEEETRNFTEKIAMKDKEINSIRENSQKNEDDKRILNEKILNFKKENEKLKKTLVEFESNKVRLDKIETKLKEIKDKYKISQIKLSQSELIQKEKEQENIGFSEQVKYLSNEIKSLEEQINILQNKKNLTEEELRIIQQDFQKMIMIHSSETEKCNIKIQKYEQEIIETGKEKTILYNENSRLRLENEEIMLQNEILNEKLREIKDLENNSDIDSKYNQIIDNIKEESFKLKKENLELKEKMEIVLNEIKELNAENENLNSLNSQMIEENYKNKNSNEKLIEENKKLTLQNSDLKNKLQEIQEEHKKNEEYSESLKNNYQGTIEVINSLKMENEEKSNELTVKIKENHVLTEINRSLSLANQVLSEEKLLLEGTNSSLDAKVMSFEKLNNMIKKEQEELHKTATDQSKLITEFSGLQEENLRLVNENAKLKDDTERLEKLIEEERKISNIASTKIKMMLDSDVTATMKLENKNLLSQISLLSENHNTEVELLKQEISDALQKVVSLTENNSKLILEVNRLSSEILLVKGLNSELDQKNLSLNSDLLSVKQSNFSLEQQLMINSEDLSKAHSQFESSQQTINDLNAKIIDLTHHINSLDNDCVYLKEQLQVTQSELEINKEDLKLTQDECTSLKISLNSSKKPNSNKYFKFPSLDLVFEDSVSVDALKKEPISHNVEDDSTKKLLGLKFQKEITEEFLLEIIEKVEKFEIMTNQLKEYSEKNLILEAAYKKITEEVKVFQESYKETIEDLRLDKYELVKEIEELKKKASVLIEENKKNKDDLVTSENSKKEIVAQKSEIETKLNRLNTDCEEKSKKINELNQEVHNSNNYAERIVKEKENVERELELLNKSVKFMQISMDGSQGKSEIVFLQANISNLESLNSSLEKAKAVIEVKYKKALKEKQETTERLDDMIEEIESLKQTRVQQESQIASLVKNQQKLQQDLESEQKTTNEYKNKLATLMVNSRNEPRSLTPVPKLRDDLSKLKETEEFENVPPRHCKTVETEEVSASPTEKIELLLEKIQKIIEGKAPEVLIAWCQGILGNENYLLRYPENESMVSEDSKSNVENISIASEAGNQEVSYKTHAKLIQQKKIIDGYIEKMKEKKQRIRVLKEHVKSLQGEIRKLDGKISHSNNLDIEFLKGTILKLSSKLSGLDNDSWTMLQIIFSQLGLGNEGLPSKDVKKKWGFFKPKEKK